MDTASAVDSPVRRIIGRKSVDFPRLTLDDLESIGVGLKGERAASNATLAAKHHLDNWQQFRAEQELEHSGVSVGDVVRHLKTPAGAKAAYKLMCNGAGFDDSQAAAYAKGLGPIEILELVLEAISMPEIPPAAQPNSGPTPPKA
jgi:hypothetical protein